AIRLLCNEQRKGASDPRVESQQGGRARSTIVAPVQTDCTSGIAAFGSATVREHRAGKDSIPQMKFRCAPPPHISAGIEWRCLFYVARLRRSHFDRCPAPPLELLAERAPDCLGLCLSEPGSFADECLGHDQASDRAEFFFAETE